MKFPLAKLRALILLISVIFMASNAAAISIGFSPISATNDVGSSVDVELYISGLSFGGAPSIGEFDIDVTFDSSILGFNSATYGDPILGDQLDTYGLGMGE